jgi:hypothetical protein
VLSSVKHYVSSCINVENETQENNVARMEVDNHADTTCFGSNFMLAYYTGKDLNLHGEKVALVGATFSKTRHSKVNAEELSRQRQIGLQMARDTLKVMTQFGIRHAVHPLK